MVLSSANNNRAMFYGGGGPAQVLFLKSRAAAPSSLSLEENICKSSCKRAYFPWRARFGGKIHDKVFCEESPGSGVL